MSNTSQNQKDGESQENRLSQVRVRSAEHLGMIIDTAMDGIISMNESQNIILFNGSAEEIFGWQADQVLGRPINLLIPKRFLGNHRQYVEQFGSGVIQSRRMGVQRTVMALRASGEEFPIEASISRTSIDNERIYTVILRDVTEAIQRRQQIERQSQMLEQVSDAVSVVDMTGRIVYWNHGASHSSVGQQMRQLAGTLLNCYFKETPKFFQ